MNHVRAVTLTIALITLTGLCGCQKALSTVDERGFRTVNLRPYCTAGFATDKKPDPPWNDLRIFPVGRQEFLGIPFDIIDETKNHGKSQIELGSSKHLSDLLPKQVVNIDLGGLKAKTLYILQKSAWSVDGNVGEYRLHYAQKDLTEVIPLVIPKNLKDWHGPRELPEAKVAWSGNNGVADVGVYLFTWENPHPEVALKSLDFISFDSGPVLSLIAITGK